MLNQQIGTKAFEPVERPVHFRVLYKVDYYNKFVRRYETNLFIIVCGHYNRGV